MKTLTAIAAVLGVTFVLLGSPPGTQLALEGGAESTAAPASAPTSVLSVPATHFAPAEAVSDAALDAVVQRTCVICHSDGALALGTAPRDLSLSSFSVGTIADNAEVGEKMIRKLRTQMMPPPGYPVPAGDTMLALVTRIEEQLDRAVSRNPNPGVRPFQRLNRPEYEAAIKSLFDLEVDAGWWLPLDTKSANFDNIADVQGLSPLLLDSYMNAAAEISRMAVGDRNAVPIKRTYTQSDYVSQHPWDHVEGAPYGTRGGMVVDHVFPADGYYDLFMTFAVSGSVPAQDIDVSIDGEHVALLHFHAGTHVRGTSADNRDLGGGVPTDPIFIRAGQRKVSVAFVRTAEGPYEDLIRPHEWALAGLNAGTNAATLLPHMRDLVIHGPFDVAGVSDTPSRQRVFSCRPTTAAEEPTCARQIIGNMAGQAYRRPVTQDEVTGLMMFYEMGIEADGNFEGGVRMALEAILANPSFYFRIESQPGNARDGRNFDLADVDLASRLSFFLWGTPPDAELMDIAQRGRLEGRVLEEQARRMIADPRAEAFGTRFAGQWLRLQDIWKVRPDANFFPNMDQNLSAAMVRETELFFYELLREDGNILDMFTADYTYVNERLARHYGFTNVAGNHFRRVQYPDETRVGVLGHGSVLMLTSMANRTSPVLRGKWVMEVLMGSPPPPPPANVPPLEQTGGASAGRILTTRGRMEIHRAAPACRSCHLFMDPIGLALDNFDVMGKYRFRENGAELDTRGDFYDGTPISNQKELSDVLVKRPIPLVRNFTENLLTYALGRRLETYDMPLVRQIAREAERSDYSVSSFILGVVNSDAFQMRRAEVAQTEDGR